MNEKWEYTYGHPAREEDLIDFLNKYGKDGWILCAVTEITPTSHWYYFRRKIG